MSPLFESFIQDYKDLKDLLLRQSQLSFQVTIDAHFKKIFLMSCASYHEHQIQEMLEDFLRKSTNDIRASSFAINKGIKRQYHTYFKWDNPNNINNFLGLFGESFKEYVSEEIKNSDILKTNVRAFIELGNLRNLMAHGNLLTFHLEKTFEELVKLNGQALDFVSYIKEKLDDISTTNL